MVLKKNPNLKLYYSISEVAEMFDLRESTLRFWEKQFPLLKPQTKGPSQVRQYTEKDIEQVRLIHNLVKVRGFKIAAAKQMMSANRKGVDKTAEVLERLQSIKEELCVLKRHLDGME